MKLPGAEKRLRVLLDWLLDLAFPRDIVIGPTAPPPPVGTTARPATAAAAVALADGARR